jgi:hypothetical protein
MWLNDTIEDKILINDETVETAPSAVGIKIIVFYHCAPYQCCPVTKLVLETSCDKQNVS